MNKNKKQIKNKKKFLGIFIPCATVFSAAVAGIPALVLCTYHHLTMPYKDQRWVDIDEHIINPCEQVITYHLYLNESKTTDGSLVCSVENHPFNNDKFRANLVQEPNFIDDKHFTIGIQLSPMEDGYEPQLLDCANFDVNFKYVENDKTLWEDNIFNLRIRWGKADW